MDVVDRICTHVFSHPGGIPGRLGGMIMARSNRRMACRAVELLDVQPNDRVLEIGFGPGVGIQLVANSTPAQMATGIDPSDEMLEQARSRNTTHIEAGRVSLRQGSVERLPFENAVFDKAMAIRSMQLWPDVVSGLKEIQRVLRPEGRIVLGFTDRTGQVHDELAQQLESAGFAGPRIIGRRKAFFALATKRS